VTTGISGKHLGLGKNKREMEKNIVTRRLNAGIGELIE
jgi:hypothetical protein